MNWFSRQPAVIEAPESDADRLALVERQYREAERQLVDARMAVDHYRKTHKVPPQFHVINGKMFIPVGGLRGGAELGQLERLERQALRIRNERMRELAEFKMRLGLVR